MKMHLYPGMPPSPILRRPCSPQIDRSAAALSSSDKIYFGQEPAYMTNVLGRNGN